MNGACVTDFLEFNHITVDLHKLRTIDQVPSDHVKCAKCQRRFRCEYGLAPAGGSGCASFVDFLPNPERVFVCGGYGSLEWDLQTLSCPKGYPYQFGDVLCDYCILLDVKRGTLLKYLHPPESLFRRLQDNIKMTVRDHIVSEMRAIRRDDAELQQVVESLELSQLSSESVSGFFFFEDALFYFHTSNDEPECLSYRSIDCPYDIARYIMTYPYWKIYLQLTQSLCDLRTNFEHEYDSE